YYCFSTKRNESWYLLNFHRTCRFIPYHGIPNISTLNLFFILVPDTLRTAKNGVEDRLRPAGRVVRIPDLTHPFLPHVSSSLFWIIFLLYKHDLLCGVLTLSAF